MKKILFAGVAVAGLMAFGMAAQAADWNLEATNKGSAVINLGAIQSASNTNSINSSNSIQAVGASAGVTGTVVSQGVPNPGATTINASAKNTGALVLNAGMIGNAANNASYGSSNTIGAVGAAASVTVNIGQY